MTTVADGLFQYGGSPVGTSLLVSKIFSTHAIGRPWFVDTNKTTNGSGKSPKYAFNTMQHAFNVVHSGDIIYFVGKVKEQLVTPVQIFDVTVVGCGNRPRHADSTPAGGSYATATWAAPDAPVAGQALVRVIQQGWRFMNFVAAGLTGAGSIEVVRNAASGDDERDGSHTEVLGVRFAGIGSGVKFGAASFTELPFNVHIAGCTFQDNTTAITGSTAANRPVIEHNIFMGNTNHIVAPMTQGVIQHNIFGKFTTASINLSPGFGGLGLNIVTKNYLSGSYTGGTTYVVAQADDEWAGNFNTLSGGITVADPA